MCMPTMHREYRMAEPIPLPNGVVLDHAERLGLPCMRAFLATHPDGMQEYLLINGTTPVYSSTSLEAAAAHLDIMALQRAITPPGDGVSSLAGW